MAFTNGDYKRIMFITFTTSIFLILISSWCLIYVIFPFMSNYKWYSGTICSVQGYINQTYSCDYVCDTDIYRGTCVHSNLNVSYADTQNHTLVPAIITIPDLDYDQYPINAIMNCFYNQKNSTDVVLAFEPYNYRDFILSWLMIALTCFCTATFCAFAFKMVKHRSRPRSDTNSTEPMLKFTTDDMDAADDIGYR